MIKACITHFDQGWEVAVHDHNNNDRSVTQMVPLFATTARPKKNKDVESPFVSHYNF